VLIEEPDTNLKKVMKLVPGRISRPAAISTSPGNRTGVHDRPRIVPGARQGRNRAARKDRQDMLSPSCPTR